MGGEYQQAKGKEHRDLHQPGDPLVEPYQAVPVNELAVAKDEPCNVYGKEPASPERCHNPVRHHDQGQGEDRVQAFEFELEPVNEIDHHPPHPVPDETSHCHLLDEERDQGQDRQPGVEEECDGADGQEDRHGVIARGLELEERAQVPLQASPLRSQYREDRSRVGRRDDGRKEKSFQQGEPEHHDRNTCHEERREQHPQRGEHCCLRQHRPDFRPAGVKTS